MLLTGCVLNRRGEPVTSGMSVVGRAIQNSSPLASRTRPGADRLTLAGLAVGGVLAIFLCQLDVCLLQQGRLGFPPVYPLLAMLGVLSLMIWRGYPEQTRQIYRGSRGAIWAMALIAGIALAGSALPEANLAEGGKYVLYPTIDFLVFLFALPLATLFASRSNWRLASGIALAGLVLSILIDARHPGTFSFLETRAAGFGVNPNIGAALSVLLLIGVLDWKRPRLSLWTCGWSLLALIGVTLTLSRSGVLVLGLVGMLYVRQCVQQNGARTVVVLCGLAFAVGGYSLIAVDAAKNVLPMLNSNHTRTASFLTGNMDAMDVLEDSRVSLVYEFVAMIEERPLLGWGTGLNYAVELGTHNMFLARWVENGLPGLVAYLLLIAMLYRIGRKHHSAECIAVAVFLVAESFFSHNLLEDKALLLMMSLTAGRAILNAPQPDRAMMFARSHTIWPSPHDSRFAKAG